MTHVFRGVQGVLRSLPVMALLVMLAPVLPAAADPARAVPVTPLQAIEQAREDLAAIVARAHRGELSQRGLRLSRRAIEARLELALASVSVDLRPGEMEMLGEARSKLNQQILRCQEWEFFGPKDRPEWGWYPSRQIRSTDGAIGDGASSTSCAVGSAGAVGAVGAAGTAAS